MFDAQEDARMIRMNIKRKIPVILLRTINYCRKTKKRQNKNIIAAKISVFLKITNYPNLTLKP